MASAVRRPASSAPDILTTVKASLARAMSEMERARVSVSTLETTLERRWRERLSDDQLEAIVEQLHNIKLLEMHADILGHSRAVVEFYRRRKEKPENYEEFQIHAAVSNIKIRNLTKEIGDFEASRHHPTANTSSTREMSTSPLFSDTIGDRRRRSDGSRDLDREDAVIAKIEMALKTPNKWDEWILTDTHFMCEGSGDIPYRIHITW